MSNLTEQTHTLVIDRVFPHPPEKVWRALTESPLITQWLMNNDFQPVVGHHFSFRMDPVGGWDGVIESEVLVAEPTSRLVYTWATMGTNMVVTWTLSPEESGTKLKMEQSGFASTDSNEYRGAQWGWSSFLGKLETVLEGLS